MSETLDITYLDKASVLAALYNASRPLGMGFLQYDPTPMGWDEARDLLRRGTYFDYLKGRVMKVDLSGNTLSTFGYDRDNGEGAARRAITALLTQNAVNSPLIAKSHAEGRKAAAAAASRLVNTKTSRDGNVVSLGVDEAGPALAEAISRATR